MTKALQGISDPAAVPAVWAIFAAGDGYSFKRSPCRFWGRSIRLARRGRWRSWLSRASRPRCGARRPRHSRRRDHARDCVLLVVLLRDPELDPDPILYHYRLQPVGWDGIGSLGFLFVQGPLYDVLRTYPLAETSLLRDPSGFCSLRQCSATRRG